MAALALVGAPLAGYLWETLHQLLALEVDTRRVLISVPVLFLFAGVLVFASKVLRGPEPHDGNGGTGRRGEGKEAS